MSSRVIKSGVLVLSGPMTLPPLYCISTLLGPILEMVSRAYCLPVRPRVVTRMMDAEPMTMPSMVSMKRNLLALKLSTARRTISLNIMVERALASVRSKELNFGMLVVAIALKIRLLSVAQRCAIETVPLDDERKPPLSPIIPGYKLARTSLHFAPGGCAY